MYIVHKLISFYWPICMSFSLFYSRFRTTVKSINPLFLSKLFWYTIYFVMVLKTNGNQINEIENRRV